jgi:hypothetical protein
MDGLNLAQTAALFEASGKFLEQWEKPGLPTRKGDYAIFTFVNNRPKMRYTCVSQPEVPSTLMTHRWGFASKEMQHGSACKIIRIPSLKLRTGSDTRNWRT